MADFLRLTSLSDVTEMLWADGPTALLFAGGTDLLVRPERLAPARMLIDLTQVPELLGIGPDEQGWLRVGAAECHQAIADHPLVRRQAHLLSLACAAIGSIQIRNRGTLGGNLGNASPAADTIPALVCLEAQVVLMARERLRRVPVLEFFTGPGQTVREVDEVIESVRIPAHRGRQAAFFSKAGQRKGMCCSKASVALVATRHSDRRLTGVRVAMGAVAPTVVRVPAAEGILEGRPLDGRLIGEAADACCGAVSAIDDLRSTRDYRRRVVGSLLVEGLQNMLEHMRAMDRRRRARARR